VRPPILCRSGDGSRAAAAFEQTEWSMKPYSTLFGTLQVGDEVTLTFETDLPA
jgi:hypothetical protein